MTPRLSAAFSVPVRRCLAEMLERRVLLANVPDGFTDTILVDELHSPTSMEIAPDGRVFVAGQAGHLWSVAGGEATFVHRLSNVNSEAEHGFLGLVFDEGFATNGFLYVYYTRNGNGGVHNRVSRLTVSGSEVTAEQIIIDLPDIQDADFHMGGALHFGPDGKLYVAVGDYERRTLPQSLDSLAGKILRINKDGSIPSDNPFYNTASGVNRAIWARGLRNPFTFNIHPRTAQMFINDVGQESWEEVNVGQAGANYGWPMSEGPQNTDGFTAPIHYYNHDSGTCSVAGGVFYHAANMSFPQPYHDKYFFGDLCGNWARIIDPVTFQVSEFATGIQAPVDFNVGPDGSLYYLGRGQGLDQGHVGRISHAQAGAPVILDHPDDVSVSPGRQATFSVTATGGGGGGLGFQWQRDGQDIPGATAATLAIAAVRDADAGAYRVVVTNGVGSVTSNPATLTVGGQGEAPVAIIGEPTASRKFRGG